MNTQKISIIYDGDCPFCRNYVSFLKIKEIYSVELINARKHPDLVTQYKKAGYDLNQGFIVKHNKTIYHADQAIHFLTKATNTNTLGLQLNQSLFKNKQIAQILYPFLKTSRNIILKLKKIPKL